MSDRHPDEAQQDPADASSAKPAKPRARASRQKLTEWDSLERLWQAWHPGDESAVPDSLRKTLLRVAEIAIRRKGDNRNALEVTAAEWLAWLEQDQPPRSPTSVPSVLPLVTVEASPPAPAQNVSVKAEARAASHVPPTDPAPAVGVAPRIAASPPAPSAPDRESVLEKEFTRISRRIEKLEEHLSKGLASVKERHDTFAESRAGIEAAIERSGKVLPSVLTRIDDLKRSNDSLAGALRSFQSSAQDRQESVHSEMRALVEKESAEFRALTLRIGQQIEAQLQSKIDLKDVKQVLAIQQHVDETVRADVIRSMSRRIVPALNGLEAALGGGDEARTQAAFRGLMDACRKAQLVLDLARLT